MGALLDIQSLEMVIDDVHKEVGCQNERSRAKASAIYKALTNIASLSLLPRAMFCYVSRYLALPN